MDSTKNGPDARPHLDSDWGEDHWHELLETLIDEGILTWREVTSLTLGHLNPSQVGTSIASKKSFQRHFPTRKCWAAVREWHFGQTGQCADCGTRLELQADHMVPKEIVGEVGEAVGGRLAGSPADVLQAAIEADLLAALARTGDGAKVSGALVSALAVDLSGALAAGERGRAALAEIADRLDNMVLRCRRCNVIRRPSHANGGRTFLTAEAALMWLLLVRRPATYEEFHDLCREYGMTMANIRFEEAWAMARWLQRAGLFDIDAGGKYTP